MRCDRPLPTSSSIETRGTSCSRPISFRPSLLRAEGRQLFLTLNAVNADARGSPSADLAVV